MTVEELVVLGCASNTRGGQLDTTSDRLEGRDELTFMLIAVGQLLPALRHLHVTSSSCGCAWCCGRGSAFTAQSILIADERSGMFVCTHLASCQPHPTPSASGVRGH